MKIINFTLLSIGMLMSLLANAGRLETSKYLIDKDVAYSAVLKERSIAAASPNTFHLFTHGRPGELLIKCISESDPVHSFKTFFLKLYKF